MLTYLYQTLWAGPAPVAPVSSIENIVSDLAALSHHVYRSDGVTLPEGWVLKQDYAGDYTSFFGSCYIKQGPDPVIAFAMRGTEVSEWRDIMNDVEIYLKDIPSQLKEALKFCNSVFDELKKDPILGPQLGKIPVRFTGHSLGAALAQIIYASYGDNNGLYQSVVFENPGTAEIIFKLLQKDWKGGDFNEYLTQLSKYAVNYQARINAINSCNKQFGTTYQLSNLAVNYIVPGSPVPTTDFWHEYMFNSYFLETYTMDQHHIAPMCEYLAANGETDLAMNRPTTVEDGYLAYLDYDANQAYWDTYFSIVWDGLDHHTQFKYGDDFTTFKADAIHELKSAQSWYFNALNKTEEADPELNDFVIIPKEEDLTSFVSIGRP